MALYYSIASNNNLINRHSVAVYNNLINRHSVAGRTRTVARTVYYSRHNNNLINRHSVAGRVCVFGGGCMWSIVCMQDIIV